MLIAKPRVFLFVIIASLVLIPPVSSGIDSGWQKKSDDRMGISLGSYYPGLNPQKPLENPTFPVDCGVASRYLEDAIRRTSKQPDSSIILIIRPGNKEGISITNLRLKQITAYMYNYAKTKSVVAVGEKTKINGRLEIYVLGQLLYSLPFSKNKGLNLLGCLAV